MAAILQGQEKPSKSGKKQSIPIVLLVLLLIFVIVTGGSIAGYQYYHSKYTFSLSQAQTGINHLRKAEALLTGLQKNPWNVDAVQQARQNFTSASTSFVQLYDVLQGLPPGSQALPVYGGRLRVASLLVPAAIEVSQAGIVGCNLLDVLISRLHNLVNGQQGAGVGVADMETIIQDVHQMQSALTLAAHQALQIKAADVQFDPGLARVLATFQKDVPRLQAWFTDIERLLPVLSTLLGIGTPTNYLVEVLDATELRPGGGFIGNYGIITLSGGRLTNAHITDTILLDRPYEATGSIPYPAAYKWFDLAPQGWSFRDSNLDADFPTSARNGERTYLKEGGSVPVQGVVAIAPALIQHLLNITGPISVPEYQETVTASNLIARIHFHQLVGIPGQGDGEAPDSGGHSSVRKRFTELLAEHLLTRIRQLPAPSLAKMFQLAVNSLYTKDVQIYFNADVAESLLQRYQLDARIQAPSGDSLLVVDANITPNKANSFMTTTMNDQITINTLGDAVHHTTLRYAWTLPGPVYGGSLYRDYLRIYVPPDSTLQAESGLQPRDTSSGFGRKMWSGFFTLSYGQTQTISLTWTVPNAAQKGKNGWYYHYLLQKQPGTSWRSQVQVALPVCARVEQVTGGLVAHGRQAAVLNSVLDTDISAEVDYRC